MGGNGPSAAAPAQRSATTATRHSAVSSIVVSAPLTRELFEVCGASTGLYFVRGAEGTCSRRGVRHAFPTNCQTLPPAPLRGLLITLDVRSVRAPCPFLPTCRLVRWSLLSVPLWSARRLAAASRRLVASVVCCCSSAAGAHSRIGIVDTDGVQILTPSPPTCRSTLLHSATQSAKSISRGRPQ